MSFNSDRTIQERAGPKQRAPCSSRLEDARAPYRFNLEKGAKSGKEIQATGTTGLHDHTYFSLGTFYMHGNSVQRIACADTSSTFFKNREPYYRIGGDFGFNYRTFNVYGLYMLGHDDNWLPVDSTGALVREVLRQHRGELESHTPNEENVGAVATREMVDVSLSPLRRGAREVNIVCLERREQMPAAAEEIEEAEIEGVHLHAPRK